MNYISTSRAESSAYSLRTLQLGSVQESMSSPSILLPPPANAPSNASPSETLLALSRQTAFLQQTLQDLLDAQSNGLLAGLGRAPQPAARAKSPASQKDVRLSSPPSRSGSRAPPQLHAGGNGRPQDLPLSAARRQIHTTLLSLASVKSTYSTLLASEISSRTSFLAHLDKLVSKKSSLEAEIVSISTGAHGLDGVTKLEAEEQNLATEIRQLEDRLAEKKARLIHVRRRREEKRNTLDARLSSWKGALGEVERQLNSSATSGRDIDHGLVSTLRQQASDTKNETTGGEDVWSLPQDRRTVEMIREAVETERKLLETHQLEAEKECEACVEGAEVWKGVVRSVRKVEKRLEKELNMLGGYGAETGIGGSVKDKARSTSFGSATTGSDVNGALGNGNEISTSQEGMKGMLELMGQTAEGLERQLRGVEDKGWNLLVCSIGGELEALIEGREMLEKVLGISTGEVDGNGLGEMDPNRSKGLEETVLEPKEGGKDQVEEKPLVDLNGAGEDEDVDGPSADLLVSTVDD